MNLLRLAAVPAFVCLCQTIAGAQPVALTLDEALARARAEAPSVLIARARIEEARGRLAGARVRVRENPTIDAAIGPRSTDTGTLTDVDIGITQMFETGGQRAARMAGADAAIAREHAATAEATRLSLRDVALAFVRLLHAQEQLALLQAAETVASDVVNVANRRYTAGDIAILDVNIAKTSLARARAARLEVDAARIEAAGRVQRLIGLPRGSIPTARGALRIAPRLDLPDLLAAIENRPDLRALRADIADADAESRLGQAMTRPDIGASVRYKHEERDRAVLGGLTISLPVFSRGQELQTTGTARASRLRVELEATRAAGISEVESAYAAYSARQAAVASFEQDVLTGLDENERLAQRSFDVGQISLPELLLIRRELVETRLEYLDRLLTASEAAINQDASAGVLK